MIDIKRTVLEQFEFRMGMMVPKGIAQSLTFDQMVDFETQMLKVFLTTLIPGTKTKQTIIKLIDIPVTWWDHFKQSIFPKWLLLYFPVKLRHEPVVLREYHICPHIEVEGDSITHIDFLEGKDG